jgi:hypothetical protein
MFSKRSISYSITRKVFQEGWRALMRILYFANHIARVLFIHRSHSAVEQLFLKRQKIVRYCIENVPSKFGKCPLEIF